MKAPWTLTTSQLELLAVLPENATPLEGRKGRWEVLKGWDLRGRSTRTAWAAIPPSHRLVRGGSKYAATEKRVSPVAARILAGSASMHEVLFGGGGP
jgi:hypothetical protein